MNRLKAFTVVELLIVIVIIGILAAVTIVGYTNISQRAIVSSLQSDLSNNAIKLKQYNSEYGSYPTAYSGTCPSAPVAVTSSSGYCLNLSSGVGFTSYAGTTGTFSLRLNRNSLVYQITDGTPPTDVTVVANTYAVTWGGTGYDTSSKIIKTSDGGLAVSGYASSFGAGGYDAYLAKYDITGNLQWNKTWGTTGTETAQSVTQTNDGGYVLVGYSDGFGAAEDILIYKLDSTGNLLWTKRLSSTTTLTDEAQSVSATSDGGCIVAGFASATFGTTTGDAYITKLDSAGNITWSKTWGGSIWDSASSVIQTSDGGYAMTGYTVSFGAGGREVFLVKYDSAGNVTWNKTWGTASDEWANSVIQTSDGGYAITGVTYSYGAYGDSLFLKLDSTGNVTAARTWGGTVNMEQGQSIIQTSDGGYATTGVALGGFGAGAQEMYMLKYDSTYNLTWSKTFGGTSNEWGYGIVQTSDNGYAVAGSIASYGAGSYDMFIAKYDSSAVMTNCNSVMCQTPTSGAVYTGITTIGTPAAAVANGALTLSSPTGTANTPTATTSLLVAP